MVQSAAIVIDTNLAMMVGGVVFAIIAFLFIKNMMSSDDSEDESPKKKIRGATMSDEEEFECGSCGKKYDNEEEADKCCTDEAEDADGSDADSFVLVNGKLVEGHFECQDKECGWKGSEEDTEGADFAEMKSLVLPTGEVVYVGKNMDERSGEGEGEVADLVVRRCPDCNSIKLKFVTKEVPKQ